MIGEGMSRYDRLTLFRAAALQGILANPGCGGDGPLIVKQAIRAADALMAAADAADKAKK